MADLNDGKPYHVMPFIKGVPPLWPEAKEGDRVQIHNGRTIKEYEFREGDWCIRATAYVRD
jgi:hypothetical protein